MLQSFLLGRDRRHHRLLQPRRHIYIAALLTLHPESDAAALICWSGWSRRIEIRQEIEPLINVPLSILISAGCLTLVGYVVAQSFITPKRVRPRAALWATTLWRSRSLCS